MPAWAGVPIPEVSERVERRLQDLHERHLPAEVGRVASYYDPARGYYGPELAGNERDQFGIAVATLDGQVQTAGDCELLFALQSLSKVFVYVLALADHGRDEVLRHVGVEPTGDPFHSIAFDTRHNRPYNPMVNAGALVTTDLVRGRDSAEKLERIVGTLRAFAGNDSIDVDPGILESEMAGADRNRATAYLMRSLHMLSGDVGAIIELYLQQCSVTVTCRDIAVMAATLANGCVNPLTGECTLPRARVRDVMSVMYTCGMYDAAGQWAYEVGVPAKSGVSGGILAPIPGKMGIGVFSPGLDHHGNSVRGVAVCKEFSDRLGLHVFATDGEDAVLGDSSPAETR